MHALAVVAWFIELFLLIADVVGRVVKSIQGITETELGCLGVIAMFLLIFLMLDSAEAGF
jgi:hypothetical protein